MAFGLNDEKMSSNKLDVILLKTTDHQKLSDTTNKQPTDRYVDYLTSQNIPRIHSVEAMSLLKFEVINADLLAQKMTEILFPIINTLPKYSSLILTSRQTIESIEAVLERVLITKERIVDDRNSHEIFVYCVGNATAMRFNSLKARISEKFLINVDRFVIRQVGVEKSGVNDSGEYKQKGRELAKLIIKDFQRQNEERKDSDNIKFAFYPCSSIRKDDLSRELLRANVTFDELHVYKTTHSETALLNLENLLEQKLGINKFTVVDMICLVFFSPSCVDAVFASNLGQVILKNIERFRIISIGPSTSSELKRHVNEVIELKEPSPQALVQAFI